MAYGFSDFDLRGLATPTLVVPGDLGRPFHHRYSSILGLAVDNIVKWVSAFSASERMSFDAIGHELRAGSVKGRLLYPRHMRHAGAWRIRLGVPIPQYDAEEPPLPPPTIDEIIRLREAWDRSWQQTIVHKIVRPILEGRAETIEGDVLARYLVDFVFAPQLGCDGAMLAAAAGALHGLLKQISATSLVSSRAVIDANFGFYSGKHFVLSAIEPDLLLDATLIDIKLTMPRRVPRRTFEEMIRYLLCFSLHQFSEGEELQLSIFRRFPSHFPIQRIGFFVADGARLVTWDRKEWVTDEQLEELRLMYAEDRWIYARRHQPHDRSQMKLFAKTASPGGTKRRRPG